MTDRACVTFHETVGDFWAVAGKSLLGHEAKHNLLIGLLASIEAEGRVPSDPEAPLLITVERAGEVIGCAVRTPPHNLVIGEAVHEALMPLAEGLFGRDLVLPGVVGPSGLAAEFARVWSSRTNTASVLATDQGIYELRQVSWPIAPAGFARVADDSEREILERWMLDFAAEALPNDPRGPDGLRHFAGRLLQQKAFFVWESDGVPQAMTGVSGETQTGVRVVAVYTPPENRRQGYAAALVARVSQMMLARGKTRCFLYTDLTNPTANSIYLKIGYRKVADSAHYVFAKSPIARR